MLISWPVWQLDDRSEKKGVFSRVNSVSMRVAQPTSTIVKSGDSLKETCGADRQRVCTGLTNQQPRLTITDRQPDTSGSKRGRSTRAKSIGSETVRLKHFSLHRILLVFSSASSVSWFWISLIGARSLRSFFVCGVDHLLSRFRPLAHCVSFNVSQSSLP